MFGDVALKLLKMMGHSATVPGALLAEDIPSALQKLQAAIEADRISGKPEQLQQTEDDEAVVSLYNRALPLIELLKAADKDKCAVMWDSNS